MQAALYASMFSSNSASSGGGIFVNTSSTITASNCSFTHNTAGVYGGALDILNASFVGLEYCDVVGNAATWGGGIYYWMDRGMFIARGGVFERNNATNDGGGLMAMGIAKVCSYPVETV